MEDFVYDLFEQIVQFASVSIGTYNSVFLQRFFATNGEVKKTRQHLSVRERASNDYKLRMNRDHKSQERKYLVILSGASERLLTSKPFWELYFTRTLILPIFVTYWLAIIFKKKYHASI